MFLFSTQRLDLKGPYPFELWRKSTKGKSFVWKLAQIAYVLHDQDFGSNQ